MIHCSIADLIALTIDDALCEVFSGLCTTWGEDCQPDMQLPVVRFHHGVHLPSGGIVVRDRWQRRCVIIGLDTPNVDIYVEKGFSPDRLHFEVAEPVLRCVMLLHCGASIVHSSAVVIGGRAAVFPAWGGTGKTNLMLRLVQRGCGYMADDFTILSGDMAYHLSRPVNLFQYNIKANPRLSRVRRSGMRSVVAAMTGGLATVLRRTVREQSFLGKAAAVLSQAAGAAQNVKGTIDQFVDGAVTVREAPIGTFFHLVTGEASQPVFKPVLCESRWSDRMAAINMFEWSASQRLILQTAGVDSTKALESERLMAQREREIAAKATSGVAGWVVEMPAGDHSPYLLDELVDRVIERCDVSGD